jgi:hypothetical protein
MKQGRTIQEIAAELERQRHGKRDFIVDSEAMRVSADASSLALLHADDTDRNERFGMTGLFHRQIGSALGIPSKYYDKMQAELPELLATNLNSWLGARDTRHTIRTLDGHAHAFLSDRYRRIDNFEIATATLPVIAEMDGVQIESAEITENRMYLKAVNHRLEAEVVPGDVVQAGIVISNSEVGLGSVSVMPLVYRLVCTNGMIVNDLGQKKYHIGREQEMVWELFSNETMEADDRAFMLKLRDTVRSAVEEARFQSVVDKLRAAVDVPITGSVPKVIELTGERFGLNHTEQDGVLQHLIAGGDLSMYGLSNAITRASQDVENYDRATALESIGWQVVSLPSDAWRTLNEGR